MLLRDQSILQDRLRQLSKQKKSVDDKYISVKARATELNINNEKLIKSDRSSSLRITDLESNINALKIDLQSEKDKFDHARKEGVRPALLLLNFSM